MSGFRYHEHVESGYLGPTIETRAQACAQLGLPDPAKETSAAKIKGLSGGLLKKVDTRTGHVKFTIYAHAKPTRTTQTLKDLVDCAFAATFDQIKGSPSIHAKACIKVLEEDKAGLKQLFYNSITPEGELLLQSVLDKTYLDKSKLPERKGEPGNSGGIYIGFGIVKKKLALYVGRTNNFSRRWTVHDSYLASLPKAQKTSSLNYQMGKRVLEEGNEYTFIAFQDLSQDTAWDRTITGLFEAIVTMMLGSYQGSEDWLDSRAKFGLPELEIVGQNSHACHDSPNTGQNSNEAPCNPSMEPYLDKIGHVHLQLQYAQL